MVTILLTIKGKGNSVKFLKDSNSHFNIANLVTFGNITSGLLALYLITTGSFFLATIFLWVAGGFDILDGKLARKYNLSNQFGIQLDSFADFLSFVIVPSMLMFYSVYLVELSGFLLFLSGFVSIFYIISGLRRLIVFNIKADEGSVDTHFEGVPTPLGAIFLWMVYLLNVYIGVSSFVVMLVMLVTAYLFNTSMKIKHL